MKVTTRPSASPRRVFSTPRLARWTLQLLSCGISILLGACAGAKHPTSRDVAVAKAPSSAVLSPGDVIRLTFRGVPELNQSQKVRTDGRVSLLQVGTVKAAGKSLDALQTELAARYELKNAGDLTVSLESTYIAAYVTGAVGRPGKVLLDRPMTVLEAIMESGGFERSTANLKRVTLTRLVNGKYVTRQLDLRDPSAGVEYVQPYDMIEVGRYFQ
jgi:polysaccharide biosynthesis/export protein